MATQPDDLDDDAIDQTADDSGEDDAAVNDNADAGDGDDEQQADDEEDVVSFAGTEATGEVEPEGLRNLRTRLRQVEQEKRELEQRIAPKADDVGAKPNIDDYWEDPDKYDTDLLAWNERKRKADERVSQQDAANRAAQERWQAQEREFETSWGSLRNAAKDAARAKVEDAFDATQQAMLVKAARGNAAGLFFMLGSSDERRAELLKVAGDPVEFVATAAVMAKDIQVTKRTPSTQPETVHRGSGGSAGKVDAKLERLEREAAKTNDRTELIAYKRELRERGK
jgi:hypothetical protein